MSAPHMISIPLVKGATMEREKASNRNVVKGKTTMSQHSDPVSEARSTEREMSAEKSKSVVGDSQRKVDGDVSMLDEANEDMETTENGAEWRDEMEEAKEHLFSALLKRLKAKGTDVNYWLEVARDEERLTTMIRYIEKDLGMVEGDLSEIDQWIADMIKLICTKMLSNELQSN